MGDFADGSGADFELLGKVIPRMFIAAYNGEDESSFSSQATKISSVAKKSPSNTMTMPPPGIIARYCGGLLSGVLDREERSIGSLEEASASQSMADLRH